MSSEPTTWRIEDIREAMDGDLVYARDEDSQVVAMPPSLGLPEPSWDQALATGSSPGDDLRDGIHQMGLSLADRARATQAFWAAMANPGQVQQTELRRQIDGCWHTIQAKLLDLRHQRELGVVLVSLRDGGPCEPPKVVSRFGDRRHGDGSTAYFERPRWYLLEIDRVGTILTSDGETREILGREPEDLLGHSLIEFVHPDDHVALLEMWGDLLAEPGGSRTIRVRALRPNATVRWIEATVLSRLDSDGSGTALVVAHDVTERRRRERDLRQRATRDALTGLPNRTAVEFRLAELLSEGSVTVAFIDLDGFKDVNDTMGHLAGDEVLEAIGGRLRDHLDTLAMEPAGIAGRWGGDEFVLVGPGRCEEQLRGVIDGAVAEPITIGAGSWHPGCSYGFAHGSRAGDGDALLRSADAAMYGAKQRRSVGR